MPRFRLRAFTVFLPLALLAPGAVRAETITRGPYLQALLADSALVLWRTETAVIGRVTLWREGDGEARSFVEDAPSNEHRVAFGGLEPDTVYRYQVEGDAPARFRTPPPSGQGTLRAAVIGDSGQGEADQHAVTALLESLDFDLFLHSGDQVYRLTIDEVFFQEYRALLRERGSYLARGNHDNIALETWWLMFPPPDPDPPAGIACALPGLPCGDVADADQAADAVEGAGAGLPGRSAAFYSFDWGPAHFAVLDSGLDFDECSAQQIAWLCRDLEDARARGVPWRILLLHHTVYTTGLHCTVESPARRLIPPIADRFGIDLVISGHDHNYQRTFPLRGSVIHDRWQEPRYRRPRGTLYVVTGGGGAGLYDRCFEAIPTCNQRCRSDLQLFKTYVKVHHAVEIEATAARLELRAFAAGELAASHGEEIDRVVIEKDGERPELAFLRGDADWDGRVGINDAIRILNHLFLDARIDCSSPADAQDDGEMNIADAIYLLGYLFLGSNDPPPPPFPRCAPVPGANDPRCERSGCLEAG